jgi:hypothetical protein
LHWYCDTFQVIPLPSEDLEDFVCQGLFPLDVGFLEAGGGFALPKVMAGGLMSDPASRTGAVLVTVENLVAWISFVIRTQWSP